MLDLFEYYDKFQVPIFLSSITIGTFLFTMKTFIIQTIKKEIYDSKQHKNKIDTINNHHGLNNKTGKKYYGSLKNLSRLLLTTITISLLNAILQISIGYIHCKTAIIICLVFTAISWTFLFVSLFLVGKNMTLMIDYAEEGID